MGVKWCKNLIKSHVYWIFIFTFIAIIVYVSYYFATKTHQENLVGNQDVAKSWSEGRMPSTTNWHEHVDIMYYINLDHREDRRKEFLGEMERMGVPSHKIVRVPAINKPKQGDWGCSLSHIKAMQMFQESSYTNCIVFEDDYMFTEDLGTINTAFQTFFQEKIPYGCGIHAYSEERRRSSVEYDVCMLSCSVIQSEEIPNTKTVLKLLEGQTTSGYMVSKTYCPTLLANYQEGATLIENSYKEKGKGVEIQHAYCVDQYWKRLQPAGNWYVFNPKLGKQRDSFSDIMGGNVKMEV
jgi:NADH:ubiquinone oxidoreductase subunit 3 (subunit A)